MLWHILKLRIHYACAISVLEMIEIGELKYRIKDSYVHMVFMQIM